MNLLPLDEIVMPTDPKSAVWYWYIIGFVALAAVVTAVVLIATRKKR